MHETMLVLLLLLCLPRVVQTFTVIPSNIQHGLSNKHPTELREPPDAIVTSSPKPAVAKEKKLTKEATELLQILDSKQQSGNSAPLIVAQVAPSVRVAISEEFGQAPGAYSPGLLVAALKKLGFDLVLDTNTAADLTICEEGTELLNRLQHKEAQQLSTGDDITMPLFTSCCPGWLNMVEKSAPELAPYISSCKSPHMMYGAVLKENAKEWLGTDDVYFASVMPCVRKRGESDRDAFEHDGGVRDVDNVITTRDLGQLLRSRDIDPSQLEPEAFDSPFQQQDGAGTGAGQLFGATGGVMEAAVRTVYEIVTKQELPRLELDAVRGLEGVKEATLPLYNTAEEDSGLELKVAVVSGLGNVKQLIKKLKAGDVHYDFVEAMACPGGCINGGGQPRSTPETVQQRLDTIYQLDRSLPRRKSHENPVVQRMYKESLTDGYGGDEAHRLLHVKPVYGETPKPKKPKNE